MDRHTATAETSRLARELFQVGTPPGGRDADTAHRPLLDVLKALALQAKEPASLGAGGEGKLFSRLHQLPERLQVHPLLCLRGKDPYAEIGGGIRVSVRNNIDQPIRVTVDAEWIPDAKASQEAELRGAVSVADTGTTKEHTRDIAPGETVELPAKWAAIALCAHSRQIHPPATWDSSSAVPDEDRLEEVGWRLPGWGEDYDYRPPEGRKKGSRKNAA